MSLELSQPTSFHTLYTAGPPITDPSMFFGRQADLEKIVGLILTGNFVMLTGPRRIGKTSVLHQLVYHLPRLTDHAEKLVPVLVNVADNLPELWGDYGRIRQVILNLVSNAHKYTTPGGEISILADTYSDDDFSGIAITIQDTGIGISEADQSQLFTQFFRASDYLTRSESGTGLGLAIAKNLTEVHGGKLTFESQLGQGSSFTVILPSKS